ncbi:hypothetical protein HK102_014171 [Quaeritorhiza haematococci]|nr:hypothetical protein HK102_014171 [Quaeritorhiza haematococci]
MADNGSSTAWWPVLSNIIGWTYFLAWSISFYPQVILNYRRKSVAGLSHDFLYLNLWGFLCYTIYNVAMYASPTIREEYQKTFGTEPLVDLNDVGFGLHAVLISAFTIYQTFIYTSPPSSRTASLHQVSAWVWLFNGSTAFAALVLYLDTIYGHAWALDFVYFLSFIKMLITLVKYTPQAYMNWSRKSTAGWSIGNILLDFTGGSLSIAQLFIDASLKGDWTGVTGNPVKFGLGLVSIAFDFLFMYQHYILYPHSTLTEDTITAPISKETDEETGSGANSMTHTPRSRSLTEVSIGITVTDAASSGRNTVPRLSGHHERTPLLGEGSAGVSSYTGW